MNRWLMRCLVVLALSAIYLYGFPSPTLTYEGGVVVHLGAGIVLSVLLARYFLRLMRSAEVAARVGWVILALGGAMGLALIFIGGSNRFRAWLYVHIALCVVGTVVLAASWAWSRGWLGSGVLSRAAGFAGLLLLVAGLAAGTWWTRNVAWRNANRIVNPAMPAETMDARGRRPEREVFPCVRADERWREHSREIFYAVGCLPAVPSGYLQTMEQFGASFFFVQQSVVPEKH